MNEKVNMESGNIENWIESRVMEYYKDKYKVYKSSGNRASQLGHPCLRYLYLERVNPDAKSLPETILIRLFSLGSVYEKIVRDEIEGIGLQVIEQHSSFYDKEYNITGSIDFKVVKDDKVYPVEVKSFSQNNFYTINSIEDIKKSDKLYIKMYLSQIYIYLYLTGYNEGLMILKNKTNNDTKVFKVVIDYQHVNELLEKAKVINNYVEKKEIPDIIDNTTICMDCPYLTYCMPNIQAKYTMHMKDEYLDRLQKREQLKAEYDRIRKEYEELDNNIKNEIKTFFKVNDIIYVEDKYVIKISNRKRKEYKVPAIEYIDVNIKKLQDRKEEEE